MTLRVERHPDVEADILGIAAWLARSSQNVAWRFLAAVEDTVSALGHMPAKGSPKRFRDRRLAGVRSWQVVGFPRHLVLYEIRPDHVYVFAVVHGARRLLRVLRTRVP